MMMIQFVPQAENQDLVTLSTFLYQIFLRRKEAYQLSLLYFCTIAQL